MSDTPRTDAEVALFGTDFFEAVPSWLSRDLERELAVVTAERDKLLADKVRAQSTINTWLDAIAPSGWVYELRKERDRMRPVVEAAQKFVKNRTRDGFCQEMASLYNAVDTYEAATCPSATDTP